MSETARQLALPLETHRNHFLFSDYYLNEVLSRQAAWRKVKAEAEEILHALAQRYGAQADALPHYNEAQTEEHWIRPVLEVLGHVYEVQPRLPEALGTPDYAFFADQEARQSAASKLSQPAYWETVLAVGDAKRWDRPLDKRIADGAPDAFTNANPCYQIDYYLRRTGCDWGIVTNGRCWRLYHRETSFRLDVFYEVDLVQLIEQGDPTAFRYFALFFSAAAFRPAAEEPALDVTKGRCWLDEVLAQSMAYAVRVGDELKERVYESLRLLAQGFLDYRTPSPTLPRVTREGAASPLLAGGTEGGPSLSGVEGIEGGLPRVHDACLILLYRLLFLFYAESRGLLPLDNPSYARQYSLKAIKEEVARKLDAGVVYLPHKATLWDGLRTLFEVIYSGHEALGVPAYDGGLFDPARYPFLEEHVIGDRYLAAAVDLLARAEAESGRGLSFVDYRDLAIRHLGSIYEGLLEYKLAYAAEEMAVVRRGKGEQIVPASTAGNDKVVERFPAGQVYLVTDRGERKATGSYYTPDYIVKYIVEQTLGPLADAQAEAVEAEIAALKARNKGAARRTKAYQDEMARLQKGFADQVLALNVLDPAMGSGHFLVEATDYLARRVVEAGVTTPELGGGNEASELGYWRRRVVERCIYGVDLNPLAVELAKLSLWLATVARGKPLSFLDHHLRCGNSLVGARVADLHALPERKKTRRKTSEVSETSEVSQLAMWDESTFTQDMFRIVGAMRQIQDYETADLISVKEKERLFEETVERERDKWRQVADLWTATYFGLALTPELYRACVDYARGRPVLLGAAQAEDLLARAHEIWQDKRFFHWEIEFPEVFFDEYGRHKGEAAGFDAVVGNPPYVRSINLKVADPEAWSYYRTAFEGASKGEFDIYLCFAEQGHLLLASEGHLGYILPNKWFTSKVGAKLRERLLRKRALHRVVDFGSFQVFEGVTTYTCLLFLGGSPRGQCEVAVLENAGETAQPLPTTAGDWQVGQVSAQSLDSEVWTFAVGRGGHLLDRLDNLPKLSDIATVFMGTGTRADAIFVLERQGDTFFSRSLGQMVELEDEIIRPSLTGRDIDPYVYDTKNYLLFPYQLTDKGAQFINPHEMRERFPLAWQYLSHPINRGILEGRERGKFIDRRDWYCHSYPRNLHLLGLPKIVLPDVAGRAEFACDFEGRYIVDTAYGILLREGVPLSLQGLAAILNSTLMTFFLSQTGTDLRGGYFRMKTSYLNPFPVPGISFTTLPGERARLVEDVTERYYAYLEHGEDVMVRAFVAARLEAEPEQADVVHDLLAFLAEQMIDLHRQKQAEAHGFLGWLADYTGLPVDDWALKTSLRRYYEHDWAEMQRVLKRNQRRLPNVALDVDAYKNEPAAKIRAAWQTSTETLRPLLADIATTDRLIDRIVYQLYGLSEEEIAVVEGQ
jgi:type I restriction-modification system DNA methylase subunit